MGFQVRMARKKASHPHLNCLLFHLAGELQGQLCELCVDYARLLRLVPFRIYKHRINAQATFGMCAIDLHH